MTKAFSGNSLNEIMPLYHAMLQNDSDYDDMGNDYSVTTLLKSPRIVQLERRYQRVIAQAPYNMVRELAAFRGSALHARFEKLLRIHSIKHPEDRYLIEVRLWDRICDRRISGQFDVVKDDHLYDWKTTSVWKRIYGDTVHWEEQANIYAYLLSIAGRTIRKASIIAWYSDWLKTRVYESGYPKTEIEEIPLTLWPYEIQEHFLRTRIRLHRVAEDVPDDALIECTPDDMWQRPTVYAVYKVRIDGTLPKKAAKLFDNEPAATKWIERQGIECTLQIRDGKRVRCEDGWCAAADFCNQYHDYLKKGKNGKG